MKKIKILLPTILMSIVLFFGTITNLNAECSSPGDIGSGGDPWGPGIQYGTCTWGENGNYCELEVNPFSNCGVAV